MYHEIFNHFEFVRKLKLKQKYEKVQNMVF